MAISTLPLINDFLVFHNWMLPVQMGGEKLSHDLAKFCYRVYY